MKEGMKKARKGEEYIAGTVEASVPSSSPICNRASIG